MTPPQFHLAARHMPAAHRYADDTAGLFPARRDDLRAVAEQAVIDAAVSWREGCTLGFEEFVGYRIRGALYTFTEGWRANRG